MAIRPTERSVDGRTLILTCKRFAERGLQVEDVARHFGIRKLTILGRLLTLKKLYPEFGDFKFKVKVKQHRLPIAAQINYNALSKLALACQA